MNAWDNNNTHNYKEPTPTYYNGGQNKQPNQKYYYGIQLYTQIFLYINKSVIFYTDERYKPLTQFGLHDSSSNIRQYETRNSPRNYLGQYHYDIYQPPRPQPQMSYSPQMQKQQRY